MSSSTTRWIGLAAVLAAFAALPSLATGGIRDGRSPDTRDAAFLAHFDGRSPDTVDAAFEAHATAALIDGRSPDTRDAATAAPALTPTVAPIKAGGFDWADAGIGAAGGFAAACALAGGLVLVHRGGRGRLAA